MKKQISQAIVVEGRDDVDAVSRAIEALIIPTHGFGITKETYALIDKAYAEKGVIILTDPDYSGEEIRRKLAARCPDAIDAYIAKEDALEGDDIGVENATPEVILAAIEQAIGNQARKTDAEVPVITMSDMMALGLSGNDGSGELREQVCKRLGIGYGNAKAMIRKLSHWGIGIEELEQTIKEIQRTSE